jgi:hypothetical protein
MRLDIELQISHIFLCEICKHLGGACNWWQSVLCGILLKAIVVRCDQIRISVEIPLPFRSVLLYFLVIQSQRIRFRQSYRISSVLYTVKSWSVSIRFVRLVSLFGIATNVVLNNCGESIKYDVQCSSQKKMSLFSQPACYLICYRLPN